jgi:hypothetical protein
MVWNGTAKPILNDHGIVTRYEGAWVHANAGVENHFLSVLVTQTESPAMPRAFNLQSNQVTVLARACNGMAKRPQLGIQKEN